MTTPSTPKTDAEYDEDIEQLSPEAKAKMDKLQKLLRLHQNAGTPEEAEAAMARAQEIATRYNIELARVKVLDVDPLTKEPFLERSFVYGSKMYRPMEIKYIQNLLAEFFSVSCFTGQRWNNERVAEGETYCVDRKLFIFGRQSDVMFASYVYEYLRAVFPKLWRKYKAGSGKEMDARRSFYYGVYCGIHANLRTVREQTVLDSIAELPEAERKQTSSNYQLMVVGEKEERKKEMDDRYSIVYRTQKSGNIYDGEARSAGRTAGLKVKISRALGDNKKSSIE